MKVLGFSAYYHDAAACLVIDGRIVAAAQEERFSRKKHDAAFPAQAIAWCLREAGIAAGELDHIVFHEKPFLKFERLFETYLAFAPGGFRSFVLSLPVWLKDKLFQKRGIIDAFNAAFGAGPDWARKLRFSEHHLSHAASAFFPSPFDEAAVLTMDGVGEWTTTSLAIGCGNQLTVHKEIHFPHSLGLLYSAFTYYLGFKVNSGEYKVMGLAPHGKASYAALIKQHLIDIKDDGSFRLDMGYFGYCTGLTMTNARFAKLFGGPPRQPEAELTQRDMDLAASVQAVIEEVVIKLARAIRQSTGQRYLCLAGGVALNCVANGKLLHEKIFDDIWVQPAAGDAGGAVGAALAASHILLNQPRTVDSGDGMSGAFLGPHYAQHDIEQRLAAAGAMFTVVGEDEMIHETVQALIEGKAVGWHQGRMEFGPRALGGRSILADPRSPTMQQQLNLKVKYRESFRPFAPSVLREQVGEWFDFDGDSPYMQLVVNVKAGTLPAITHVDGSARLQTVHHDTNPLYHKLITKFHQVTGCPVLVNTSFNVRGEPMVNTPEEAFRCLMGSGIGLLAVGNCIVRKAAQNPTLVHDYRNAHEPD